MFVTSYRLTDVLRPSVRLICPPEMSNKRSWGNCFFSQSDLFETEHGLIFSENQKTPVPQNACEVEKKTQHQVPTTHRENIQSGNDSTLLRSIQSALLRRGTKDDDDDHCASLLLVGNARTILSDSKTNQHTSQRSRPNEAFFIAFTDPSDHCSFFHML